MKSFGFNTYGAPEVFETIERPKPEPKNNQVLIKTVAFGVNPYDVKLRRGSEQQNRPLAFPIIPGSDVVGQIAAMGSEVTDFEIGDWVINLRPLRGYSEYVTATTSKIVKKPKTMSILDAASLPTPGVAAYNIIHRFLKRFTDTNDKTIAVIGASGTVGSIVVQIAKSYGNRVIGIGAKKNAAFMHLIGVDEMGFYDQEDVGAKFENQADFVVNAAMNGTDNGLINQLVKAGGGSIATVGDIAPVITKSGTSLAYVHQDKSFDTNQALRFLTHLSRTFGLIIRADEALPFNVQGVITAHQKLEQHTNEGHLVIAQKHERTTTHGPAK
ncbi:NADP-dependent oxidoreductase [Lactobacillus sp. CC-MHH1034]|uniref:NADP-dependent oxidoreductase n=1 Tax=Agrilactobacillus fermenti TaxID=2586909 RepID=UPI001E56D739|nr:NADP-dependent oxidoreductase [Agrilactobacillus fermenti]MCD2256667.1 NADP-dependent oxidoreductase [Agrilactobacillus fermenti]